MAADGDPFDSWLGKKLQSVNPETDLEVFVQYIRGIVETETSTDEKLESISDILISITEDGLEEITAEILKKWDQLGSVGDSEDGPEAKDTVFDQQLAGILSEQKQCVIQSKEVSAEQRERKAAILAQYAQVSDGEVTDEEGEDGAALKDEDSLLKNVNVQLVINREKDQREKDKQQAESKKLRDKEDREKQKTKATDRKEAEKKRTQKGERKR